MATLLQRRFGHPGAATIWTSHQRIGQATPSTHWTYSTTHWTRQPSDLLDYPSLRRFGYPISAAVWTWVIILTTRFHYGSPPPGCIGHPRSSLPHGRRAESFADDLNTRRGIVSGRVPCCHDPLRSSPASHGFVPPPPPQFKSSGSEG